MHVKSEGMDLKKKISLLMNVPNQGGKMWEPFGIFLLNSTTIPVPLVGVKGYYMQFVDSIPYFTEVFWIVYRIGSPI